MSNPRTDKTEGDTAAPLPLIDRYGIIQPPSAQEPESGLTEFRSRLAAKSVMLKRTGEAKSQSNISVVIPASESTARTNPTVTSAQNDFRVAWNSDRNFAAAEGWFDAACFRRTEY